MTTDRLSGGVLLLLALYVIWENRVLPLGSHHNPGPGYIPLLLALTLGVVGLIILATGGSAPKVKSLEWEGGRHALAILGCCLFATLGMEYLGYRLTMIIILGFLFGVVERLRVWQTVLFGLGFPLLTFWVFDGLLSVVLPRGEWGF